MYVLDTSAIIASINRETGADQIDAVLFESVIGTVALAEAHTKVSEWGGRGEQALAALMDVEVITADRQWSKLQLPCRVSIFR